MRIMLPLKNLHKTYSNGVHAIDDVSLDIPNGWFGLLGPNGAGKSSLMRTIATLQDPDSGTMHFNGVDIVKKNKPTANLWLVDVANGKVRQLTNGGGNDTAATSSLGRPAWDTYRPTPDCKLFVLVFKQFLQ